MLKTVIETTEGLDEAIASLYTETDGKFVLQVEGIDEHPDVRGLKNAYAAVKSKRDEMSGQITDMAARLKELEDKPAPSAKDDAEMVKLRAALEKERDEAVAKATDLEKRVYGLTVETQLDSFIREVGITEPGFAKAAKIMLSDGVKLVNDTPVVETDMGPVPLGEHVKRWASGEGKAFVTKPSGGGAGGNNGGKSSGKSISAAELETMTPEQKAQYFKANPGVTVEG